MRTKARRRSLRRAWRVMTWPLSGHVALALGTSLAWIAASRYPDVIELVVYPDRHHVCAILVLKLYRLRYSTVR
jgi:hypothetical protein